MGQAHGARQGSFARPVAGPQDVGASGHELLQAAQVASLDGEVQRRALALQKVNRASLLENKI